MVVAKADRVKVGLVPTDHPPTVAAALLPAQVVTVDFAVRKSRLAVSVARQAEKLVRWSKVPTMSTSVPIALISARIFSSRKSGALQVRLLL